MHTNHKIIIGGTGRLFQELSEQLVSKGFTVTVTQNTSLDIQFEAIDKKPHAVFISSETEHSEALIKNLMKLNPKPFVYIISQPGNTVSREIINNPYAVLLNMPIDIPTIISALTSRINKHIVYAVSSSADMKDLHNYVSEILERLCITPNYNGFIYLREAIKMAVIEPINSRSFSKCIYPKISAAFNSSPSSVERNIRTVIVKGWEKAPISEKSSIFGSYAAKAGWHPTNGEFILIIADKIHRDIQAHIEVAN